MDASHRLSFGITNHLNVSVVAVEIARRFDSGLGMLEAKCKGVMPALRQVSG
jgi:hypothetical protein